MKGPRSKDIEDILKLARPCPACGADAEITRWRNASRARPQETPSALKCSQHYIVYIGCHSYAQQRWYTLADTFITFGSVLITRRYSFKKKRYVCTVSLSGNSKSMTVDDVYSAKSVIWTKQYTDAGFARKYKTNEPDIFRKKMRALANSAVMS